MGDIAAMPSMILPIEGLQRLQVRAAQNCPPHPSGHCPRTIALQGVTSTIRQNKDLQSARAGTGLAPSCLCGESRELFVWVSSPCRLPRHPPNCPPRCRMAAAFTSPIDRAVAYASVLICRGATLEPARGPHKNPVSFLIGPRPRRPHHHLLQRRELRRRNAGSRWIGFHGRHRLHR